MTYNDYPASIQGELTEIMVDADVQLKQAGLISARKNIEYVIDSLLLDKASRRRLAFLTLILALGNAADAVEVMT